MNNKQINLVVAVSQNGIIGNDNKLLWHLPEDLKRFRKITTGQVVVMGRKTHESIGRTLPNRINVILTNDMKWNRPLGDNAVVCYSIEEVLYKFRHRDLYVIGGGQIYEKFLPFATKIIMTFIHKNFEGDTKFPKINDDWITITSTHHTGAEFDYDFVDLIRK